MLSKSLVLLMVMTYPGHAQNTEVVPSYRLDFTIKELESGKVLNSRQFSMNTSADQSNFKSSIRTGNKVPVGTENGQFSYLELGVSIDCSNPRIKGQLMSVVVVADVSSLAPDTPTSTSHSSRPIIRQNKWSSEVVVPLQKPTVIFLSDDLVTKHQMQMELTATPLTSTPPR